MAVVEGEGSFDVARFLKLIHPNTKGQCYEVRILNSPDRVGGTFLKTYYGYFVDHAKAAAEIARFERFRPPAIYLTVNPIDPSLYGRAADRLVAAKKGEATSDNFAIVRHLLFIDIDPKRPSGISATDAELALATQTANAMRDWLAEHGWQIFIEGMSGNGRYLLYRINLPNNTESYDLISRLYTALKQKFETTGVSIDESNKNAARIMKVLGTMARKGDDVKGLESVDDRPHRRSWYIAHESASLVAKESIEAIAAPPTVAMSISKASTTSDESEYGPIDNEPWMEDSYKGKFDLEQWIKDHNVPVSGPMDWPGSPGGRRWKWTEPCPLCGDHGADIVSPFISQRGDGRIIAGCRHERCKFTWRDLRTHYEPDAYSRRESAPVTHTASGVPLYVHGENGPSQHASKSARKRTPKQEALLEHIQELSMLFDQWTIQYVTGEPNTLRLSGERFSQGGKYFEIEVEQALEFRTFQKCLLGRGGVQKGIPMWLADAWPFVIVEYIEQADRIEGTIEETASRQIAEMLYEMARRCNVEMTQRFEGQSVGSAAYTGLYYCDDYAHREVYIDHTRLCSTLAHAMSDFRNGMLKKCLEACRVGYRFIQRRKIGLCQKVRVIDWDAMIRLAEYAGIGTGDEVLEELSADESARSEPEEKNSTVKFKPRETPPQSDESFRPDEFDNHV